MKQTLGEIAVFLVTSLFVYQSHSHSISKLPSYEEDNSAIAVRPINLADTQYRICKTTKVSDGDTIAVDCDGEKLKIRFCGIDAPEKKQPLGIDSKLLLSKLVEDKQVIIRPLEKDKYDRTVAEVSVKVGNDEYAHNVNEIMVKRGMAYHYARYSANCPSKDAIASAEEFAKNKKLGVWDGNHQKPWDYRRASK